MQSDGNDQCSVESSVTYHKTPKACLPSSRTRDKMNCGVAWVERPQKRRDLMVTDNQGTPTDGYDSDVQARHVYARTLCAR